MGRPDMTPAEATTRAEELAGQLRADAADRDRAGRAPVGEIDLLRRSGLLALTGELPPFTAYT